jgi:hypothetical protein
MKNSEPETPSSFEKIFTVIEEQANKPREEVDFSDLTQLVDLKKVIKKLSVQTGEDLDNKDFSVSCLNTLLNKTLLQLSFKETPSKLTPDALEKALVNLETKLSELHKTIGNRQEISQEELDKLEANLLRSYTQIVMNRITDKSILLNVAMIENVIKSIKDLDLVK